MSQASCSVLTVAALSLDVGSMKLEGPRGHVTLAAQPFRVLERLMRRPGVLVSPSDLIAAMYPDTDAEPDTADNCLRHKIRRLRSIVDTLAGDGVLQIRTEPGIGYAIQARRQSERAA